MSIVPERAASPIFDQRAALTLGSLWLTLYRLSCLIIYRTEGREIGQFAHSGSSRAAQAWP